MDTDHDRYSLASIKKQLDDGTRLPSPTEIQWLVNECDRLTRNNRALDNEVARQDAELKIKDREFSAAELEVLDLSEQLSLCRAQLDAARQAIPEACSGHVTAPAGAD